MIGKHVMVRTENAGVHFGVLTHHHLQEVTLKNARRVWYWSGAASLSQLSVDGTSNPDDCKFPCPVEEIMLEGMIEMIPLTDKARESLEAVPIWNL